MLENVKFEHPLSTLVTEVPANRFAIDSVEEFKQAVAIKFSKGYDSTVTDDNNVSWNNGHEFVEYDSIKEGSIESYVVSDVE